MYLARPVIARTNQGGGALEFLNLGQRGTPCRFRLLIKFTGAYRVSTPEGSRKENGL
jgi:hypothetical protein